MDFLGALDEALERVAAEDAAKFTGEVFYDRAAGTERANPEYVAPRALIEERKKALLKIVAENLASNARRDLN